MRQNCPKCGAEVYVKYPSKTACKLIEQLTAGHINAKDLYFSIPSGPIMTDSHRNGAKHICKEKQWILRRGSLSSLL